MAYFDHTYFDPAYFDTDTASAGGSVRRALFPFVLPQPEDDDDETVSLMEIIDELEEAV